MVQPSFFFNQDLPSLAPFANGFNQNGFTLRGKLLLTHPYPELSEINQRTFQNRLINCGDSAFIRTAKDMEWKMGLEWFLGCQFSPSDV